MHPLPYLSKETNHNVGDSLGMEDDPGLRYCGSFLGVCFYGILPFWVAKGDLDPESYPSQHILEKRMVA